MDTDGSNAMNEGSKPDEGGGFDEEVNTTSGRNPLNSLVDIWDTNAIDYNGISGRSDHHANGSVSVRDYNGGSMVGDDTVQDLSSYNNEGHNIPMSSEHNHHIHQQHESEILSYGPMVNIAGAERGSAFHAAVKEKVIAFMKIARYGKSQMDTQDWMSEREMHAYATRSVEGVAIPYSLQLGYDKLLLRFISKYEIRDSLFNPDDTLKKKQARAVRRSKKSGNGSGGPGNEMILAGDFEEGSRFNNGDSIVKKKKTATKAAEGKTDIIYYGRAFLLYAIDNFEELTEPVTESKQGRPSLNMCYASVISVLRYLYLTRHADYEVQLNNVIRRVTDISETQYIAKEWNKDLGYYGLSNSPNISSPIHPKNIKFKSSAVNMIKSSDFYSSYVPSDNSASNQAHSSSYEGTVGFATSDGNDSYENNYDNQANHRVDSDEMAADRFIESAAATSHHSDVRSDAAIQPSTVDMSSFRQIARAGASAPTAPTVETDIVASTQPVVTISAKKTNARKRQRADSDAPAAPKVVTAEDFQVPATAVVEPMKKKIRTKNIKTGESTVAWVTAAEYDRIMANEASKAANKQKKKIPSAKVTTAVPEVEPIVEAPEAAPKVVQEAVAMQVEKVTEQEEVVQNGSMEQEAAPVPAPTPIPAPTPVVEESPAPVIVETVAKKSTAAPLAVPSATPKRGSAKVAAAVQKYKKTPRNASRN